MFLFSPWQFYSSLLDALIWGKCVHVNHAHVQLICIANLFWRNVLWQHFVLSHWHFLQERSSLVWMAGCTKYMTLTQESRFESLLRRCLMAGLNWSIYSTTIISQGWCAFRGFPGSEWASGGLYIQQQSQCHPIWQKSMHFCGISEHLIHTLSVMLQSFGSDENFWLWFALK